MSHYVIAACMELSIICSDGRMESQCNYLEIDIFNPGNKFMNKTIFLLFALLFAVQAGAECHDKKYKEGAKWDVKYTRLAAFFLQATVGGKFTNKTEEELLDKYDSYFGMIKEIRNLRPDANHTASCLDYLYSLNFYDERKLARSKTDRFDYVLDELIEKYRDVTVEFISKNVEKQLEIESNYFKAINSDIEEIPSGKHAGSEVYTITFDVKKKSRVLCKIYAEYAVYIDFTEAVLEPPIDKIEFINNGKDKIQYGSCDFVEEKGFFQNLLD